MKKKIKNIQKQYTSDISKTALDYLKVGLELFHKRRYDDYLNSQVALGNISVAIELIIKTFLASKDLSLVFKNLPLDLKIILTCPDQIQSNTNWRHHDIEFRFGDYKTLELGDCISSFFVFLPDLKEKLNSHLRFLAKHRNTSVHSVLPVLKKYEIERAAFVALQLIESLKDTDLFKYYYRQITVKDKEFMKSFREERLERVRKIIDKAKEKAQKLPESTQFISVDNWEEYVTSCPICGNDALIEGYTELHAEEDVRGLEFFADTFHCEICGLKLEDSEELRLAGIDTIYDRSSEVDEWQEESFEEYEE